MKTDYDETYWDRQPKASSKEEMLALDIGEPCGGCDWSAVGAFDAHHDLCERCDWWNFHRIVKMRLEVGL